jgi:hypothetical protein
MLIDITPGCIYQEKSMTIPVKNNNLLSISGSKIDPASARPQTINNQNAFSDLLRGRLQETGVSALGPAVLPPLAKDQLEILVKNMQIQMNRQLFNIVFNNGAEINYFPSRMLPEYPQEITAYLERSSKNRQAAPKNNADQNRNMDAAIEKAARRYEVDPDLIRSVIKTESNFDAQAVSSKGAMGLMQLMPDTAKDLGVKNAYDPEENIMGGTRYLKTLLERYDGKVDLALAAYNWGMGNLENNPQRLPKETSNYIARVTAYYKDLKVRV